MPGEPGRRGGDMVAVGVFKLLRAVLAGPGGRPTWPVPPLGDILGLDLGLGTWVLAPRPGMLGMLTG